MKLEQMNRYQAFVSHLLISLVIFAVILVCITQYWYPGILFDTGNGWKAIGLIVGIDLVLGPLLTLLVFNPKKSSLRFDLSVIAAVQIAALAYGTWTIFESRPLALAFINKSFATIYANSELGQELNETGLLNETNQLYYSFKNFDENAQHKGLMLENFHYYSENTQEVLKTESIYFEKLASGEIGVALDPLVNNRIQIMIDATSGEILGIKRAR